MHGVIQKYAAELGKEWGIPELRVENEGPAYLNGFVKSQSLTSPGSNRDLQVNVFLPPVAEEIEISSLVDALDIITDPQFLAITPEDLATLIPGEMGTLAGFRCVRTHLADRVQYFLRFGPSIRLGEATVENLEDAVTGAESVIIFAPEDTPQ